MATKYDFFEYIYERGAARPAEILKAFNKPDSEYPAVYKMLLSMVKKRLVAKNKLGYQSLRSAKNDLLYRIIRFCVSNRINYNELLDEGLARFISEAMPRPRFSLKEFKINPRTFTKYLETLSKYGLLIIISRNPLEAAIPKNDFIKDLAGFFGYTVKTKKFIEKAYIKEIEIELKKFRSLRKRNNKRYLEIIGEYEIKFIQHSLNLEGNPITLPDTIKLLKDHIMPKDLAVEDVQEVQNYQKATKEMMRESEEKLYLTKESILNYHYITMQHRPEIAGVLRTVPVYIKGNPSFKVANAGEINKKLDELLAEYRKFTIKRKKSINETINFSAYFHNEFQHIHPFIDGNSRTARLITFHILISEGLPMLDIPLGLLQEYLFSTKGATRREDIKLSRAIQKIVFYNLRTINEKMERLTPN